MQMRTCARCGTTRPEADFAVRSDGRRRQSWCRDCKVAYDREWYARNREGHLRRVRELNAAARERNARLVAAAKRTPCADCGGRYPAHILEFDHVRGDKRAAVSELAALPASPHTLREEMAKCEVVCANCHRDRTHRRRQQSTPQGSPRPEPEEAVRGTSQPTIEGMEEWVAGESNPEPTD